MFSGTVKRKKYIPLHRIPLPDEKRCSLLAFHAITGCDTVSQFAGIGKQSAWKTFHSCSRELHQRLGDNSPVDEKVLSDAEAFVCKMYSKSTDEVLINKERSAAFRKAKKSLDSLPPTKHALHLYIKRANYQTMV